MEYGLVSVIIPTYKRADMLPRAINSVLRQTYPNIEVIVVDDNNPDSEYREKTEKIMQQYKDEPRVTYIKHDRNRNGAAARNTGIKASRAEYISFLDDDDFYYPNKIEKQVNFLMKHPEYDAVYCGVKYPNRLHVSDKSGDLSFELLSGTNIIYTITILAKREALIASGGFDESFRRHQEAVMLLRFFNCGYKIGAINEPLCEADISDRSNVLIPSENEKEFDHFLNVHQKIIDKCEKVRKGARKKIYAHRYQSVLLYYLKRREFKNALRFYWKTFKKLPIEFNLRLLKYTYKKLSP